MQIVEMIFHARSKIKKYNSLLYITGEHNTWMAISSNINVLRF